MSIFGGKINNMRLNNMRLLVKFNLILLLFSLFISCNLIISNPHARENPNDPEAQVTDFNAFAMGEDIVLTTWQWKDWYNGSDEESIAEIRILHSTLDYPQVLIPFTGESFTNNSISEFEWTGLDKKTTHYFALHMKDERNRWYAPLFTKTTLPGASESAVFGFTQPFKIKNFTPYVEPLAMTTGIYIDNSASPSVLVIALDVPNDIYILSATIETFVTSGGITATAPLRVFPVSRFWDEDPNTDNGFYQLTENFRDDYAVDDSVSAFIASAEPTLNDVTEVVKQALLYEPRQIVFKIDGTGGSTINLFNNTFMNIEYITN